MHNHPPPAALLTSRRTKPEIRREIHTDHVKSRAPDHAELKLTRVTSNLPQNNRKKSGETRRSSGSEREFGSPRSAAAARSPQHSSDRPGGTTGGWIRSRERETEPWVWGSFASPLLVCFVSVWKGAPFWCDRKGKRKRRKNKRGGFEKVEGISRVGEWEGSDGWRSLRMWIRRLRSE